MGAWLTYNQIISRHIHTLPSIHSRLILSKIQLLLQQIPVRLRYTHPIPIESGALMKKLMIFTILFPLLLSGCTSTSKISESTSKQVQSNIAMAKEPVKPISSASAEPTVSPQVKDIKRAVVKKFVQDLLTDPISIYENGTKKFGKDFYQKSLFATYNRHVACVPKDAGTEISEGEKSSNEHVEEYFVHLTYDKKNRKGCTDDLYLLVVTTPQTGSNVKTYKVRKGDASVGDFSWDAYYESDVKNLDYGSKVEQIYIKY